MGHYENCNMEIMKVYEEGTSLTWYSKGIMPFYHP